MILSLEQAPLTLDTHADLCVIGGGIAGLILTDRLARRGFRVYLLEAGGLELEDRSQSLYAAEMAADTHTGTTEGRFRTYGGSSTRWGGQLLSYTPDIYTPPPGALSRAWPMDDATLAPYYAEIQQLVGVNLLPFDDTLLAALKQPNVEFSPDIRLRFSKWIPFARRNFSRTLGERLKSVPNATVLTHANVGALEGDGTRITAVRATDYAGREFRFTATCFIVATGTIESARLLLMSPGVPNPHDQFGRCFHDHVSYHAAEFTGEPRQHLLRRLGPFVNNGTLHTCKLEATGTLRAREDLLAVMAHITIDEPEESGVAAVRALLQAVQHGRIADALTKNFVPLLRGLGDVARLAVYARLLQRRSVSARATVRLNIDLEQPADPSNRIRLSETRDALGWPKAIVDWRIGPHERDTAARFVPHIRAELERLNMAPSTWYTQPEGGLPLADTYHPMGGLIMGTDPHTSVVDPTLRVHGLDNLFVCSCAVYPAGGSSNPTFTLMALAMRLADSFPR